MEGQFSYQDFDLLIEPGPPGSYRARVLRSPAGNAPQCNSRCRSRNRGWKPRAQARPGPPHPREPVARKRAAKDFGGKLYGAVFQDELRDALQRGLTLTHAQQAGMRLADNPELAESPWEFSTTCGGPVPAQSRRVGHTGQLSGYERYCAITSDGGRHWPVRRQLSGMG